MLDFEKLGAFYLGKRYDMASEKLTDELVLYDSKDLNTHAVIIGMTGSGKTGLGVGILEEAALDHVPVIAIDPKGDMGNLLLTFQNCAPKTFNPGSIRVQLLIKDKRRNSSQRLRPHCGKRASGSGGRRASASHSCART